VKIQPETTSRIKEIVDPQSVLDLLGIHIVRRNSKELRGPCKIHGGDNPTAFRFNLETRTWCCYTRGCEGESNRDLVGLVQLVTGQPFIESVRFLADIAGVDLENQSKLTSQFLERKQQKQVKEFIKEVRSTEKTQKFYPEEMVDQFIPQRSDYFLQRGFPSELLDFFQVGGLIDKKGVQRETIPIRDEDGNLLTVSARRTDGDDPPKYFLLKDVPKTDTLYNLEIAKLYVGLPRVLILVEGFVDVWNLALNGVWNVVALMGTSVAPSQVRLLSKYADEVLLLLDPDEAGEKGTDRVEKILRKYVGVTIVKNDTDPKEMEYSQVKRLFEEHIRDV